MYSNFLIVASKQDTAGINITTQLSQFQSEKFKFYLVEESILHNENLNMERINEFDFIIFASKHKSEKKEKTLSIHAPGNWRFAEYGGEKGKACKTSSQFIKQFFENLSNNANEYNLKDYKVTLEATHHGPLLEKPCAFVEIGSTENEWKDRKAGFILAKTISDTIDSFKPNPYSENAIAIGGPHYCPNFNKIQLNSNIAISHIIPQYVFPLTEEIVKEAIDKTEEEIDIAVLDWKGLGKAEERQRILEILDNLYINYRKTSEIKNK